MLSYIKCINTWSKWNEFPVRLDSDLSHLSLTVITTAKHGVPDRHFLIKNMILSQIKYLTFQCSGQEQAKPNQIIGFYVLLLRFLCQKYKLVFRSDFFSFKDKQSIICKLPSQTLIPPYKILHKAADRSGPQSINLDLSGSI